MCTGTHVINVYYFEKPISGSPYSCQVFDWSKINVVNLSARAAVNHPVEFDSKF